MSQSTREAFQAWHSKKFGWINVQRNPRDASKYSENGVQVRWMIWQAATEAAKATGTAGEQTKQLFENIEELVPLPEPDLIAYVSHGPNDAYSETLLREFRAKVYETARRDKDGNHADDLRGMLDELQTEFDKQNSAFWACSEKLAQVQRNQETELSDIRILELAEEDFGEQDDRNVKNEALLSFARKVQAARQPAPVVVKPWETRMQEYFAQGSVKMRTPASFMADEIIDSRAALAATAAPVVLDLTEQEISELYAKNGVTPHCFARAIIDAITARSQP